jgi:hypothetical protein
VWSLAPTMNSDQLFGELAGLARSAFAPSGNKSSPPGSASRSGTLARSLELGTPAGRLDGDLDELVESVAHRRVVREQDVDALFTDWE